MLKAAYIFPMILLLWAPKLYALTPVYNLDEETNIYQPVADIRVTTEEGGIYLSEIYSGRPIILTLVYTRCAGVCNPLLMRLKENIELIDPKREFTILVLSFDPLDTLEDMQGMAKRFTLDEDPRWEFAVSREIDKLNRSIGFNPVRAGAKRQFDHEALLIGINRNGLITKKLIGLRNEAALGAMIVEINDVFVPSYPLPDNKRSFSCFNYDPATGKNSPGWGLLVLSLPATLTLLLVLVIGINSNHEHH
ncbi:MAG: SCO family protein [Candidatus Dadabacteria bacterium]|nr:SCO family protein [Candidatus Dadabacteria bacterium]